MNDKTPEIKASPVWGAENGTPDSPDDSNGISRTGTAGGSARDNSPGLSGTNWEKVDPFVLVEFGDRVLQRLIQQTENRLTEAQECITWYQRDVDKLQAELQQLKEIQTLRGTLDIPQSTSEEE